MATTDLNFTQDESGSYKASFVSQGKCVVELERVKRGTVSVYANIEGMPPCQVATVDPAWQPSAAIEVDIMSGLTVTIVSGSEVLSAKMATYDGNILNE